MYSPRALPMKHVHCCMESLLIGPRFCLGDRIRILFPSCATLDRLAGVDDYASDGLDVDPYGDECGEWLEIEKSRGVDSNLGTGFELFLPRSTPRRHRVSHYAGAQ